jgi:tight adherence protein C
MGISPLLVLAVGGVAAGAFLLVWALVPARAPGVLEQRLGDAVLMDASSAAIDAERAADLARPFWDRVAGPLLTGLGRRVLRWTPQAQIDTLNKHLLEAGSSSRPEVILALRIVGVPAGAGIGLALVTLAGLAFPLNVGLPALLAVIGYMLPVSLLKRKTKRRSREIRFALPGVLDLLTVSMEAGLSFDSAIMRVAETESGVLGVEFQKLLNEIRLGRQRMDALTAMAERNNVEEMSAFVNAVVQAEPLGVPMARVLRIQSEELRRLRRQRAEQAGHRAPVLMLLPMLGCIFPCIFVMLLGPAVITVTQSVGH